MRTFVFLLTAFVVMGLAYWAYTENYRTQTKLREVEALQSEIAALRERLGVLRAEWAFLNRPERLRDLALLNFDRLKLFALDAEQFGRIDEIAFPAEAGPDQGTIVHLSAPQGAEE